MSDENKTTAGDVLLCTAAGLAMVAGVIGLGALSVACPPVGAALGSPVAVGIFRALK